MTASQVLKQLEQLGKPNTAAIYQRHGVREPTFGVPYAELEKLVRRLGTDHELATALWATGVHDARVLATKIASPERIEKQTIDTWLRACTNAVIHDAVSALAGKMPASLELAASWIDTRDEWLSAAG